MPLLRSLLDAPTDRFSEACTAVGGIPESLRPHVERHHANLRALVETLGNAGVDDATIEISVSRILASYQAELLSNLKHLNRDASDA